MASVCIECGRATHGTNKICFSCIQGDTGDEHAQPRQRKDFQPDYAKAQAERMNLLAMRIQTEEAEMRNQGKDPNKH